MTNLHSTLVSLADTFAREVLAAIQQASLEDILAESGRAAPRGARTGRSPSDGVARPGRQPAGRRRRRSSDDIQAVAERIVATLKAAPKGGLRAEQIRAELGMERKELPRAIAHALEANLIRKTGEKRATTYFPR